LPSKTVAEEAVGIGAVWSVGIGCRRVRRSHDCSRIIQLLTSGAITIRIRRKAAQRTDVNKLVSSVLLLFLKGWLLLRRKANLVRQRSERSDRGNAHRKYPRFHVASC
jgi:hypothetical protein